MPNLRLFLSNWLLGEFIEETVNKINIIEFELDNQRKLIASLQAQSVKAERKKSAKSKPSVSRVRK